MKKSLIALAVLACAAGVASAGQITITNLSNGGAGMSPFIVKSTQTSVDKRSTSLPGGLTKLIGGTIALSIPDGDGITSLANGGGSRYLTAVSPASLGTGGTDPSDV